MSTRRLRWRVLGACVGAGLVLAGCTSTAADGPSSSGTTASASVVTPSSIAASSAAPSPTPSVASVPPASSAVVTSLDPAAQEAADRAAVEAQWIKYWDVYINIVRTAADQRFALAATVAVDPAQANLSKSAEYFESHGRDTYGSVSHRLSWTDAIAKSGQAVLSDCQDQSQFGSIDVNTGQKLTVGVQRDNIKARFVEGPDGVWRVSDIYLLDTPC